MNWIGKDLLETVQLNRDAYQANRPFPHVVLDDFFDADVLNSVIAEFPPIADERWRRFVHKYSLKLALTDAAKMGAQTRNFISHLNGPEFLSFLEKLTGIEGLVPDPYLEGGGLHLIMPGGYLGIHADFNFHQKMKLHRRINLLVYLNHAWQEGYGSHLELWDEAMKSPVVKISPTFNRMAVFNTTEVSFHGHPDPLKSPEGVTRKSIALYYYSATRPAAELADAHSTLYKARPHTAALKPILGPR
jgi:hypothetical protein